jgi:hypothetical protein
MLHQNDIIEMTTSSGAYRARLFYDQKPRAVREIIVNQPSQ